MSSTLYYVFISLSLAYLGVGEFFISKLLFCTGMK